MQKGPEYFVEAAAMVLHRTRNVRFVMAGSGDMMDQMIRLVAERGIADRFHFPGFMKGKQVYEVLKASDVYIMPSVSEPFGISPLEAMQCSVPSIISKQSGCAEILDKCIKTDYWDIHAMADAIYSICTYPAMYEYLKEEGKKEVDEIKWENVGYKHLKRYRFFDIGTDHYYYDDYANETGMNEVAERSYIPALSTLIEMVKNSGGAFKVALSISGVALEQLEIHAPAVIDLLHQLNDTGCCEFLCEPYSHGLSSLANEDCFREEVLRQRDKMKQMFGKEPKVFRNSSLIYSDEIGGLVASMGFKGMLTEGAKHVLGWKSPHYVYHCNQAPSLKLLLRDFKLSDDIGLRFSNSEWPEYPLFADKYINWIDALPQEEQVINIFMELSALGMAQPLSSNILEFLKALPECAKSKGITFSTPTEIVSKLKSVSQLDVPYPMSWVDEERDTSSWLGNILQREAFNKLYSVAERVHLCDDRRIKQDWDYLQASNNFRFMTTKNTGIWLNRGIYDSPYDAFTNYMNILGDFIKRVDSLYPVDVDNEELNSLLTTIKNQGEEIAELQKEVTKWQAKAEKGAVKAPKKVAAKKEPVAKATRKKATAKKEE